MFSPFLTAALAATAAEAFSAGTLPRRADTLIDSWRAALTAAQARLAQVQAARAAYLENSSDAALCADLQAAGTALEEAIEHVRRMRAVAQRAVHAALRAAGEEM